MSASHDRINPFPDLASDFLCRLSRLLKTHAAQTHLPPFSVSVVDVRPPPSTRFVNDEIQSLTVGVVARLPDVSTFRADSRLVALVIFTLNLSLKEWLGL